MVAREATALVGAENAAVVRFHGDEGLVVGAAGPAIRVGDRMPRCPPSARTRSSSPVDVEGRPGASWSSTTSTRPPTTAGAEERLDRLAPTWSAWPWPTRAPASAWWRWPPPIPLTGLANHGAFHGAWGRSAPGPPGRGHPLSLVLIDLDHFKRVNDTHGHQAGDEVLREVARRLRDCGRRGDVVARVGGEELAWLLPATDLAHGMEAAERLRGRHRGAATSGPSAVSRPRLGVAQLGPGGPADLVRRADLALYRAKAEGRDACVGVAGRGGHGSSVRLKRRVAAQAATPVAPASTRRAVSADASGALTSTTPSTASARP